MHDGTKYLVPGYVTGASCVTESSAWPVSVIPGVTLHRPVMPHAKACCDPDEVFIHSSMVPLIGAVLGLRHTISRPAVGTGERSVSQLCYTCCTWFLSAINSVPSIYDTTAVRVPGFYEGRRIAMSRKVYYSNTYQL